LCFARLTFGYNAAGQVKSSTRSNDAFAFTGYANTGRAYTPDGLNRYSAITGASPSYDANGNMTNDGSLGLGYDVENRLVTASNGTTLKYDPLGRLYEVGGGAGATRFLHDGAQIVAEYSGSDGLLRYFSVPITRCRG
jgi:hypothetical protein